MSTTPGKYADGRPYDGNRQYLGQGIKRSCGKCRQHKGSAGFTKHRIFGMICPECAKVKA